MWGTCKIVNFSQLLFFNSCDWSTSLNTKNTIPKWSVNAFYCVNGLPVGLCILCVKMRTFLCGKHRCRITKEICYPPYPDHYLNIFCIPMILYIQLVRGLLMSVRVFREQNCLAYYVFNTGASLNRIDPFLTFPCRTTTHYNLSFLVYG